MRIDPPIMNRALFSLTPNFSWVLAVSVKSKPFQRFLVTSFQAVETALRSRHAHVTWLKPGVSESGTQIMPPSAGELS
jgi:1-acyl-sn-glycerol-3-phosphate acyltransferase